MCAQTTIWLRVRPPLVSHQKQIQSTGRTEQSLQEDLTRCGLVGQDYGSSSHKFNFLNSPRLSVKIRKSTYFPMDCKTLHLSQGIRVDFNVGLGFNELGFTKS